MSALARVARFAGGFAAVGLGVLGVAAGTPLVEVAGTVVAFLAGLAGYAIAYRSGRPVARTVIRFAATGFGSVLVVGGLAFLVGPLVVPLIAVAVAVVGWRHRSGSIGAMAHGAQPSDPQDPGLDLSTLTNAQLGREWRRSHSWLLRTRTADELARVCLVRRLQLDEIERRNPSEFRRLLDSGSWVRPDSAPFLGG